MSNFSDLVIKSKWAIISIVTVLTLFFAYQLLSIKVDSNIVNSLPKDDPEASLFRAVGKRFGSNEIGMIIVKSDNVLMPNVLKDIALVTDTLSEFPELTAVTSITNIMNLQVVDDDFQVDNLINDLNRPKTRTQADSLLKIIAANEMVTGNLISKDGTAAVVMFSYLDSVAVEKVSANLMERIEKLPIKEEYYFAGAPFMRTYVSKVVRHDMTRLIPIAFLVISLLLFLSFHNLRGVFLPLLTAGLAIVWGMGVFALLGIKLSMVSNNVPIIILAVGTADAIHILNRVNHCREKNQATAVRLSMNVILVPLILTTLTTMVGFMSFIFGAYLNLIRDFGILASLGTFFAGVLAITFVPAILATLPHHELKKKKTNSPSKINTLLLEPLSKIVVAQPRKVVLIWIIIFALSIGGIFMLKRSVSVAGYFKKEHPVSKSEKILAEKFGGTKPVFIVFKGDIQSAEVLHAMMDMEEYMKKSPLIGSTQSIADIIRNLNFIIQGQNQIPDDESTIGQLWFMLGDQENLNHLITEDLDQALIIAKFQDQGAHSTIDLENYMQSYFDKHQSEDYSIQMTGMPFVNAKLSDNLLYSQIMSLSVALFLVMIIVSLMLKSIRKGLFASLPIVVTIGIMYGMMGYTGIPLNIVTVLVASIAMGIGIDYSIHFFSHFNDARKSGKPIEQAIVESINISGKAIIINFVSVSLGFGVLIFSDLIAMIYFGIIIALSMFGASMGALTLLPSMLLLEHKKDK
jgi:predicted RND superfamily exporter protein